MQRVPVNRALIAVLLASVVGFVGCAPYVQPTGDLRVEPRLEADAIVAFDGRRLPLRHWPAAGVERAVILALHGFNDHSRAWEWPAAFWASYGVTTYAFDQRGFGRDPNAGEWGDTSALLFDVQVALRLLRGRHGRTPLFLVGESMGGAIALAAMETDPYRDVDGLVLSAPAVWGREAMPLPYRISLELAARTAPALKLTGQGLGRRASDNVALLRQLGRDPLFIKETRIDAIYGLVQVMDRGLAAAGRVHLPTLVLYGQNDEIVPKPPVATAVSRLNHPPRVALYPEGWHMLFRDRQGAVVWQDVLEWILNPDRPLPSGAEAMRRPLFPAR